MCTLLKEISQAQARITDVLLATSIQLRAGYFTFGSAWYKLTNLDSNGDLNIDGELLVDSYQPETYAAVTSALMLQL